MALVPTLNADICITNNSLILQPRLVASKLRWSQIMLTLIQLLETILASVS